MHATLLPAITAAYVAWVLAHTLLTLVDGCPIIRLIPIAALISAA